MLDFLIDNIFVSLIYEFSSRWSSYCAPFRINLFLHLCVEDFFRELSTKKERKKAQAFNLSFLYKDDVLS